MAYLTSHDLATVKRFLYNVRRKWYNIGLELGVEHNKLDEIQDTHRTDYDTCVREMLKIWLKFYPEKPTWGQLADALKQRAIDERELADEGKVVDPREEFLLEIASAKQSCGPVHDRSETLYKLHSSARLQTFCILLKMNCPAWLP